MQPHTVPTKVDSISNCSWETFRPYYDELIQRPLRDDNRRAWLTDWSNVARLLRESFALAYIGHSLDTSDAAQKQNFLNFVENIQPPASRAEQQLKERLVAQTWDDDDLQVMVRNLRGEFDLFREANVPLLTDLSKLGTEYDKLTGGLSIEENGETLNLNQIGKRLDSSDREERRQGWQTLMELWQSVRAPLNDLYEQMIDKRQQLAVNADLPDHREYAFRSRKRYAYTPTDCYQFHDAIEAAFVPAAQRIMQRKQQQLGYDRLRPWDWVPEISSVAETFAAPLRPFDSEQELIEQSQRIFARLDGQLGRYFGYMAEEKLLDLMTRQGKALGGYCMPLPLRKRPFIFMNATGTAGNIRTMLHEAGHAFHGFEAMGNQPLVWQQRAPMEFNEVASMAMELLPSPYMTRDQGGFFDEAQAAQFHIQHLEKIILFMPFMAVVDRFQHWVYTNVDLARDSANRDQQWDALWQRFLPGIDWSGYEDIRAGGWQRKRHIFTSPFYYIEYGMAQIGALQVWRNSLSNHQAALERYRAALALGGTRTLPQLFEAAGAEFRFDTAFVGSLLELVEATLSDLYALV